MLLLGLLLFLLWPEGHTLQVQGAAGEARLHSLHSSLHSYYLSRRRHNLERDANVSDSVHSSDNSDGPSSSLSSSSSLETSRYCHASSMTGRWVYLGNESSSSTCRADNPLFKEHSHAVNIQLQKYSCSSYRAAEFKRRDNCSLLSPEQSADFLKGNVPTGRVVFVGDSLMMQQYIAAQCDLSNIFRSSSNGLTFHFVFDAFLRPNIPCATSCIHNASFRLDKRGKFPDVCAGCPEGAFRSSTPPHSYSRPRNDTNKSPNDIWWMQRLPRETRVLIISTGAWYNKFQGLERPSEEYQKTLFILKSIFRRLLSNGIIIIWLALPAMVDDISIENRNYGWNQFEAHNAQAFKALEYIGVTYVDAQLLLLERKLSTPNISPDGLHWCNVGSTGIPSFLNQIIFHHAALEAKRKAEFTRSHKSVGVPGMRGRRHV